MSASSGRRRRIVVGISGASGAIYGVRLLHLLRELDIESHLVVSRSAQVTLTQELDLRLADVQALADVCYPNADIGASISSGSFRVDGMIVAPCSIKTLSEVATGCTSSLLSRAADVVLKERRRLVLMVRETPLHAGHIRSLAAVTEAGAMPGRRRSRKWWTTPSGACSTCSTSTHARCDAGAVTRAEQRFILQLVFAPCLLPNGLLLE
jgi:4-hydroxy-3-polyprenylbenzoate decarboxylase